MNKHEKFFEEAVRVVTLHRIASASFLQRTLDIKYEIACELIEMLESRGLIGPAQGSKPRKVLISPNDTFLASKISNKTFASLDKIILAKLLECLNNTIEGKLRLMHLIFETVSPMGLDPRATERIALYAHLLGLKSGAVTYVEEYKTFLKGKKNK